MEFCSLWKNGNPEPSYFGSVKDLYWGDTTDKKIMELWTIFLK